MVIFKTILSFNFIVCGFWRYGLIFFNKKLIKTIAIYTQNLINSCIIMKYHNLVDVLEND